MEPAELTDTRRFSSTDQLKMATRLPPKRIAASKKRRRFRAHDQRLPVEDERDVLVRYGRESSPHDPRPHFSLVLTVAAVLIPQARCRTGVD